MNKHMCQARRVAAHLSRRLTRYVRRFATDAYIISHPKSGRTWLRVMIGKALCLRYRLPQTLLLDTYRLSKRAGILRTDFSHDYADNTWRSYAQLPTDKRRYASKKVIFLARNIKDVIASYYFHSTKRSKKFSGDISTFVRSDHYGVKKVVRFYNIWHANRDVPREFIFVRYENLHENPQRVLRRTLRSLGVNEIEDAIIDEAVAFADFDHMQRMEKSLAFENSKLQPTDIHDPNSFKVREGKVGGHAHCLSLDDIQYIDDVIREFGCPFDTWNEVERR